MNRRAIARALVKLAEQLTAAEDPAKDNAYLRACDASTDAFVNRFYQKLGPIDTSKFKNRLMEIFREDQVLHNAARGMQSWQK